jgi:hypothetical protein
MDRNFSSHRRKFWMQRNTTLLFTKQIKRFQDHVTKKDMEGNQEEEKHK